VRRRLWAGPAPQRPLRQGGTQAVKNRRLLAMMPPGSRARPASSASCLGPHREPAPDGGRLRGGHPGPDPRGSQGFGFDPVFLPWASDRTFGELPSGIKQTLSHRAQAAVQAAQAVGVPDPGLSSGVRPDSNAGKVPAFRPGPVPSTLWVPSGGPAPRAPPGPPSGAIPRRLPGGGLEFGAGQGRRSRRRWRPCRQP